VAGLLHLPINDERVERHAQALAQAA